MRPQKSKTAKIPRNTRTTRNTGSSHPRPVSPKRPADAPQSLQTPKKKPPRPPQLDNAQKKLLRALGHELKPVIQIGKEGLTETLLASTDAVLKARELIKVRLGQGAPLERAEAAEALCRTCGAALVQEIGHVLLLYRPNPNLPAEKRIKL